MVGKWQGRDSALDRGFDHFFGPMCQAKISYFHEVQGNPYYKDRERVELPDDFYLTDSFNEHALSFLQTESRPRRAFFPVRGAHRTPLAAPCAGIRHRAFPQDLSSSGVGRCSLVTAESTIAIQLDSPLEARATACGHSERGNWKSTRIGRLSGWPCTQRKLPPSTAEWASCWTCLKSIKQRKTRSSCSYRTTARRRTAVWRPAQVGLALDSAGTTRVGGRTVSRFGRGSGPDNLPGPHDTFAAYGLAWALASNTPFRGTKLDAYEGGIRTPLVVSWPAVIQRHGLITTQVGHVIDFMPTLLDVAGAEYPSNFGGRRPLPLEGKSLLPIFRGETRQGHDQLCWSVPRHDAIRSGRWKAIRSRSGKWQLFDIEADGTETTDLSKREPQRLARLARQFESWQKRVGAERD